MTTTEPTATGERVLALLPDRDSPPKRDWSGAFRPAAVALVQHLRPAVVDVVQVPVPTVDPVRLTITGKDKQLGYEAAARATCQAIERGGYTRVVLLCHGWATGLQLGIRSAKQRGGDAAHLERFIGALAELKARSITLFACSAGDAPGSSASAHQLGKGSLAEHIAAETATPVLAHWTAGHTTRNPDLIHFQPTIGVFEGAADGGVPYERGTPEYRRARALLTSTAPSGTKPPKGHTRPAWASLVLCSTLGDVQRLLASEPGA